MPTEPNHKRPSLTIEQRVVIQRAVEQVLWSHRSWPKENTAPKPAFSAVMSETDLREKVADGLRKSYALELEFGITLDSDKLQSELERVVANSQDPSLLRELFAAAADDPTLIAECILRSALADRLLREAFARESRFQEDLRAGADDDLAAGRSLDAPRQRGVELLEPSKETQALARWPKQSFDTWWRVERSRFPPVLPRIDEPSRLRVPPLATNQCVDGSWRPTPWGAPLGRWEHSMIWTGTEVLVFGGNTDDPNYSSPGRSGAHYSPVTDTWTEMPIPDFMSFGVAGHDAIWTGTEMIIWSGDGAVPGGRYQPSLRQWRPIAPLSPSVHERFGTAIWTGTGMLVWGGRDGAVHDLGAIYDPTTDTWRNMSLDGNPPSPRFGHTAVWTGSHMLIWGGNSSLNGPPLNSGGSYDPVADSWTAMTLDGAPNPATLHVAVWTGSEMIVWRGGPHGSGRYSPSTDTWKSVNTGPTAPPARARASVVWTGDLMIIWGGDYPTNTGARYDPRTDQWTSTNAGPSAPSARASSKAVWTGSEMIVWGGYFPSSIGLDTGGRYRPQSDTWIPTSTGAGVPRARFYHSAVWTGVEMIIWGGLYGFMGTDVFLDTGATYSPVFDSWTATSTSPGVPRARYRHGAVWTGSEMIIWGGTCQLSCGSTGARYNPGTGAWTPMSLVGAPPDMNDHTPVWTGSEMLVWSGKLGVGGQYEPLTDLWKQLSTSGEPSSPRVSYSTIWSGQEMIVWGGYVTTWMNDGVRYDPVSDSWTPTAIDHQVEARTGHSTQWIDDRMILWGGTSSVSAELDTGAEYSPANDAWVSIPSSPFTPSARTAAASGSTIDEFLVWGGYHSSGFTAITDDSGGRYSPETGVWRPMPHSPDTPIPRFAPSTVSTGEGMIIWGGLDIEPFSSGGVFCARACEAPSTVSTLTVEQINGATCPVHG